MKVLSCQAARRRLQAYHDGELPMGEQINVDAHVQWCDGCATALHEMQMIRAVLRTGLPGRSSVSTEEAASLQSAVVSRVRAENDASWSTLVRTMFDDMHMVYAGLGAAAATVVCVMVMANMMRFATNERSPGSNQNPVVVGRSMLMPRPLDQALMTSGVKSGDDGVFTLSAVVTREGRIVNLELHSETGETLRADSVEGRALEGLRGSVSRARFEPARVLGLPVAVNMVWMVAHTTVRAAVTPLRFDAPLTPGARKRRVMVIEPASISSRRVA